MMDSLVIFAIFGWLMALVFLVAYLAAQSKLDDYRTDSYILRKLRARYPDIFEGLDDGH